MGSQVHRVQLAPQPLGTVCQPGEASPLAVVAVLREGGRQRGPRDSGSSGASVGRPAPALQPGCPVHSELPRFRAHSPAPTLSHHSPADMAIVVPATMPMVTPPPRGGGRGAGYTVAGMPLGCTTVVWWMTCGGAAYRGCV